MRDKFWAVLALTLAAIGCVTEQGRPAVSSIPVEPFPSPPPEIPEWGPPDLTYLAGRRVFIDPGHGGKWPGTVAPSNSLRESEVNLAVSLKLAEILRAAGAAVGLSRSSDAALGPSLAEDLAKRGEAANVFQPDVFLSVHHNADIAAGSTKNDLEVYYALRDPWVSRQLGEALTIQLARRFRIDAARKRLLPGNYKVLRDTHAPAVLLETSYLTHALDAGRLASATGAEQEAWAIAAGLADYFALEPPRLDDLRYEESESAAPRISARVIGGSLLDTDSSEAALDGVRLPGRAFVGGSRLYWALEEPLPNRASAVSLHTRNAKGAYAATTGTIEPRRPAHSLEIRQYPPAPLRRPAAQIRLEVTARDAYGQLTHESSVIELTTLRRATKPVEGAARFYLAADGLPETLEFRCGRAVAVFSPVWGEAISSSVQLMDNNRPARGIFVMADGAPAGVTDLNGWMAIPGATKTVSWAGLGYQAGSASLSAAHTILNVVPIDRGVLHQRRIAIDPMHGGRDAGHTGPSGLRSADLALETARRLAAMLRNAGADVFLTRDNDVEISEPARLIALEEFTPDLLVAITYGSSDSGLRLVGADGLAQAAPPAFAAHYPGSANGARAAQTVAQALSGEVMGCYAYLVQQASAPAVLIQPARPDTYEDEDRLRRRPALEPHAEGIYKSLVNYFSINSAVE